MQAPRRRCFDRGLDLDRIASGQIAQASLAELARSGDAKVSLKLDIEAESVAGFPEYVASVVTAHEQTLKVGRNGFE